MKLSPQVIIAESIADALGLYFIIDPKTVETNLIQNAGIKLKNVKLQPVKNQPLYPLDNSSNNNNSNDEYITVFDINGNVSKASFHWNWGGSQKDGGSKFVNSAQLVIDGIEFVITLKKMKLSDISSTNKSSTATTTSSKSTSTSSWQKYVQDQVDRIIDTLTLSITNFTFKIQVEDTLEGTTSSHCLLMFGGNSIQLESMGRAFESGPLQQILSLDGIYVSVVDNNSGSVDDKSSSSQEYPLLSPFSYTSSCTRVSGKRFESGIMTDLTILGSNNKGEESKEEEKEEGQGQGQNITSTTTGSGGSSMITIHAGEHQIRFLNILGGYLWKKQNTGGGDTNTADTITTEEEDKKEESSDPTSSSSSPATDDQQSTSSSSSSFSNPTVMKVPLDGLTVVFPNESKISVQGLLFQYKFDGSWQKLSGSNGFAINDHPNKLLDLPDPTSCWEMDFVKSKFQVYNQNQQQNQHAKEEEDGKISSSSSGSNGDGDDTNNVDVDNDEVVASIWAHQGELQYVKDGMTEFLSILNGMTKEDTGVAHEIVVDVKKSKSTSTSTLPAAGAAESSSSKSSSLTTKTSSSKKKESTETTITTTTDASSSSSSPSWTLDLCGRADLCLLDINDDVVVECIFCNTHVDTGTMTFQLESIEEMIVPGTIRLKQPIKNTTAIFDGNLLNLTMGDVVACLLEPPESQKPLTDDEELEKMKKLKQQQQQQQQLTPQSSTMSEDSTKISSKSSTLSSDTTDAAAFALPFAATASIESITIYQIDNETVHSAVKAFEAAIGPDVKFDKATNTMVHTGAIRTLLVVDEFNHKMIQAIDPKVTAVVRMDHLDKIEKFDFSATTIGIAAGYSVFHWKRLFETGDENRNKKEASQSKKNNKSQKEKKKKSKEYTKLPFAHVHPLKVHIVVTSEDRIINLFQTEGTTLHFNEFKGNEKTTTESLTNFYTTNMITNVPGVVANANVLGFHLGDQAAGQVGIVTGATALSGLGSAATPVAGVLGMIGFDGIKGAIRAGKRERGAQEDDKTNFTDFFRGIGQSAKEATEDGLKMRGKSTKEKADALDWAVGATAGVGEYADENKSRLGGAGAAVAGFAYGMILGGPLGGLAGALVAGAGTSATIDALDEKFSKKKQLTDGNEADTPSVTAEK